MMRLMLSVVLLATALATGAEVKEERVSFAGAGFRVVRVEPQRVNLVWKDAAGVPYRSFGKVRESLAKQRKPAAFLMNAGIFEPGGIPSGLHIEDGKTLLPLNLADAPGNFFLKPNGVCALTVQGAWIGPSTDWKSSPPDGVRWAIQSGPLLLIRGGRHPAFREKSANALHRNGVGVDDRGRFVFAITAPGERVNLWDFAGLFLHLGCKDALFLDGDISQMAVSPAKAGESNLFGAMFVIPE